MDYDPDMGWLGYFAGKNDHLEELSMDSFTPTSGASVMDVIVPFFKGVNSNKSIRRHINFCGAIKGGEVFTMLGPFFQNNYNLTNIEVRYCGFGEEGSRLFALGVGSSTNQSLKDLRFCTTIIFLKRGWWISSQHCVCILI